MTTAARTLAEIDALLSFLAAVEADAAARAIATVTAPATATATVSATATPAANDTAPAAAPLRFLWNGIKEDGGKLQRAWYSDGATYSHPAGTITVYARTYAGFSRAVAESFHIENGTDIVTDYFEKDAIYVEPSHPLFHAVRAALAAQREHNDKIDAKRNARRAARRAH